MWYENLKLRGLKEVKKKGLLYEKLYRNYKSLTKTNLNLKTLAAKVDLTPTRLNEFLSGVWEDIPAEILSALLQQIQISPTVFRDFAKKTAIPGIGIFDKNLLKSTNSISSSAALSDQVKPIKEKSIAPTTTISQPAKLSSVASKASHIKLRIKNYNEEAFIITFAGGLLEIHPNDSTTLAQLRKNKKKVILVPNAVPFGDTYVPGEATVEE